MTQSGQDLQRRYYERTAARYSDQHVDEGDAHFRALLHVSGLIEALEARSLLDVGSGTGRVLQWIRPRHPELHLKGIEPVLGLIEQAESKQIPKGAILAGRGESLPFADRSFDVVCSFGVLHHVPEPGRIQREMLRCARKAVLISDSNRFGQGRLVTRLTKLGLYLTGAWPLFDFIRTRGKGYMLSEGDGVFYSYSVFDTLPLLQDWADRVYLIPTELNHGTPPSLRKWLGPLLGARSILVCGLRDA